MFDQKWSFSADPMIWSWLDNALIITDADQNSIETSIEFGRWLYYPSIFDVKRGISTIVVEPRVLSSARHCRLEYSHDHLNHNRWVTKEMQKRLMVEFSTSHIPLVVPVNPQRFHSQVVVFRCGSFSCLRINNVTTQNPNPIIHLHHCVSFTNLRFALLQLVDCFFLHHRHLPVVDRDIRWGNDRVRSAHIQRIFLIAKEPTVAITKRRFEILAQARVTFMRRAMQRPRNGCFDVSLETAFLFVSPSVVSTWKIGSARPFVGDGAGAG